MATHAKVWVAITTSKGRRFKVATKKVKFIKPIDTHVRIIAVGLEKVIKPDFKLEAEGVRNTAVYKLVSIIAGALPDANCILHSVNVKHHDTKVDICLHFSDADGNGWLYIEQYLPAHLGVKGKSIAASLKCGVLIDTWDANDNSGMCVVTYKKDEKLTMYKNADKRPWNSKTLENFIKKCSVKKT